MQFAYLESIQNEIRAAHPAFNVEILGVNHVLESAFNYLMTEDRGLPWLQDTTQQDVWNRWQVNFRDVRILDAQNRLAGVFNLTQYDLSHATNRQTLKDLFLKAAAFSDTDEDGLPDDWEQLYFGDLSAGPDDDSDGDGASNLQEFALGSNPTLASSRPVAQLEYRQIGMERRLAVVFARQAGGAFQYLLETSGDLAAWAPDAGGFATPVVSNAFDGTGTATMIVPLSLPVLWPDERCFRVKALAVGQSPLR